MTAEKHLSVFELDTWFVTTPEDREPAVEEHLAACATCKRYVGELVTDRSAPAKAAPRARRRRALLVAARVVAVAASFAFVGHSLWSLPMRERQYVGVKGVPAAQVLVRRDGRVQLWDGVSRVRRGDALAMRVDCAELEHVTVAMPGARGIERVWEGPCDAKAKEALPFTLVVDERPGREHVDVVLSARRLDDDLLSSAIRSASRNADSWAMAFDFDKEDP